MDDRINLINFQYIKEYGLFPQNYDLTEIQNFVPIAEKIHIIPIITQPLYDKLIEMIRTDTLDEKYSNLLKQIYPLDAMAIYYEALPFIWAHLNQTGITIGSSENSESISSKDILFIINNLESKMRTLANDLRTYVENGDFAEYRPQTDNICNKFENQYLRSFYSFRRKDYDVE